jgi:biopolymer transport protein TolQ
MQAHDLSALSLFLQATLVVKLVMLGLLSASVLSWAVVIEKLRRLGRVERATKLFEVEVWSGKPFDTLADELGPHPDLPLQRLFVAAMREIRAARDKGPLTDSVATALKARIDRIMGATLTREISKLEEGLGVLAIIATSSPFIGLFGTVWGIMNAFQGIAAAQDTSLAVVAPGIAEALFATAIGLFAAIPAYIFYNMFSTRIAKLSDRFDAFSDEFAAFISRRM